MSSYEPTRFRFKQDLFQAKACCRVIACTERQPGGQVDADILSFRVVWNPLIRHPWGDDDPITYPDGGESLVHPFVWRYNALFVRLRIGKFRD